MRWSYLWSTVTCLVLGISAMPAFSWACAGLCLQPAVTCLDLGALAMPAIVTHTLVSACSLLFLTRFVRLSLRSAATPSSREHPAVPAT